MTDKHKYTVKEIYNMRSFCYQIAQRLISSEGLELKGDEDASVLVLNVLNLAENILQTYIMANLTYDELKSHYSLIKHDPI